MTEAIAMYQSFGFKQCSPYHEYPEKLMPYFVFMELSLAGATADETVGQPMEHLKAKRVSSRQQGAS